MATSVRFMIMRGVARRGDVVVAGRVTPTVGSREEQPEPPLGLDASRD